MVRSEIIRRSAWATIARTPTTISLASGMSAATNLTPGLLQAEPPALGKASPWRCQATSGVQDPLEQASTAGRLKRPQAWSIKEQTSRRVVLGLLRAGLSVPHLNRVMQQLHVDGLIASR